MNLNMDIHIDVDTNSDIHTYLTDFSFQCLESYSQNLPVLNGPGSSAKNVCATGAGSASPVVLGVSGLGLGPRNYTPEN